MAVSAVSGVLDHIGRSVIGLLLVSVEDGAVIGMDVGVALMVEVSVGEAVAAAHRRTVGSPLAGHGRRHALLLLAPVAEPHAHHLLLQLQRVGQRGDLLGRRLGLLVEVLFQGAFDRHFDAGALLALATLGGDLVDGRRRARGRIGLLQPLLQQRFQLAHVLEAELQRLEAADGRLREDVAVERAQRQPDVGLREAQFDAPLFELFGEGLQIVGRGVLLLLVAVEVSVAVAVPAVLAVQVIVRIVRVPRRRTHLTVVVAQVTTVTVVRVVAVQLTGAVEHVHRRVDRVLRRRRRHVRRRHAHGRVPPVRAHLLAAVAVAQRRAQTAAQTAAAQTQLVRFDILIVAVQAGVSVHRVHGRRPVAGVAPRVVRHRKRVSTVGGHLVLRRRRRRRHHVLHLVRVPRRAVALPCRVHQIHLTLDREFFFDLCNFVLLAFLHPLCAGVRAATTKTNL